jgi:hypothetical protein
MTEQETEDLLAKYNELLERANYWIDGGILLVEHLHRSGMRYDDIYKIMEKREIA